MDRVEQYLSKATLQGLSWADQRWRLYRQGPRAFDEVVQTHSAVLGDLDWDVVICGGTLGILLAASLVIQGWRVALVEKGVLRGRTQEWNISRQELQSLLDLELLTETQLETAIATEYNPARIGFSGSPNLWVRDVLNIGVDPVVLLETLKQSFLAAGGTLLEKTSFQQAMVHPDGISIQTDTQTLHARLLIDVTGHFSAIANQARLGQRPDGVCLVAGSCASGYPAQDSGDLIYSFTPIQHQCQYFWEAFPAREGRTTYLFTYVDAHPDRFDLRFLVEEYLRLLPEYQGMELSALTFKRFLFSFFPAYRQSPLRSPWDRILFAGDSSGSQSPVSFGGFGGMIRHLPRLSTGINEALNADFLDARSLNWLQPYQPNIAVTWLFQRTMSVPIHQNVANPEQINQLMGGVFQVMSALGEETLKPFLQDVIQFNGLSRTLPRVNPKLVLPLIPQVGLPMFMDWLRHYLSLATFTGLDGLEPVLSSFQAELPPKLSYYLNRRQAAWHYGSGKDY